MVQSDPLNTRLSVYQKFIRAQYSKFEDSYYELITELVEKIKDLDGYDIPSFDMAEFEFILDWENGMQSSSEVYEILKTFDISEVAKARVVRRLENYMMANDELAEIVKHTIAQLKENSLPLYTRYLEMVRGFFLRASESENKQTKLTWLQTNIDEGNDGKTVKEIEEITLNQVIRQLDTFVIPQQASSNHLGDNVIVFDEDTDGYGLKRVHWIFGPKAAINLIRGLYDIKTSLDIHEDGAYLKRITGEYAE